jgi:hypothetical protein
VTLNLYGRIALGELIQVNLIAALRHCGSHRTSANVATTSGYLHARPDTSSGLKLGPGIFR